MAHFKDLKIGSPLYILDTNTIRQHRAKVTSVSNAYFTTFGSISNMVVDITAEVDGEPRSFSFKHDTDAGFDYTKGSLIATDKAIILRELENMRKMSEQALKQMENHKIIVARCEEAITELGKEDVEIAETETHEGKVGQVRWFPSRF